MHAGIVLCDRFEIEGAIARGAMGAVYRALDRGTGQRVAVKVQMSSADEDLSARFHVEARVLKALSHDAIVRYVAHGLDEGRVVLAMEWVDGPTLRQRLSRGTIVDRDALALAARIAGGLAHAHASGVVHRDVKPGNVLLPGGEATLAKLADFGIARVSADATRTASGTYLGTPRYMAPEQIRAGRLDGRADVFSLGCVLFEALTGVPAFPGDEPESMLARLLFDDGPRLLELRPDLPAPIDALLCDLLVRDAARRPTAAEAERRIHALLDEHGASLGSRASTSSPPRPVPSGPTMPLAETRAERAPAADRLIGREAELTDVELSLAQPGSVVGLWGPPGIGKSRLAHEVAARAAGTVIRCDLEAVRDRAGAIDAVARSLGFPAATPSARAEAVARGLSSFREPVLVLDRADGLGRRLASVLESLLGAAPAARILVTTRARPFAPGATAIELGPLAIRGTPQAPSPAARLFLSRAQLVAREAVASVDLASIEAIARALDGVPLALEIAAARLPALGMEGLLAGLSRPLSLLGGEPLRGGLASLDAALRWSTQKLEPIELAVFERCSLFRAGFGAALADAVRPPGVSSEQVQTALRALRDSSLLVPDRAGGDGEGRLVLYGAVRDFAFARLVEAGAFDQAAGAFAEAMRAWAEPLGQRHARTGNQEALRALAAEADNLLGAAELALARGAVAVAASLLSALSHASSARASSDSFLDLAARALSHRGAGALSPGAWAELSFARARVFGVRGRTAEARRAIEALLVEARAPLAPELEGAVLVELGALHHTEREVERARVAYERAAAILSDLDEDSLPRARCLANLALLDYDQGDIDSAIARYEEAVLAMDAFDDVRRLSLMLNNLAVLDQDRGRHEVARARFARALSLLDERTHGVAPAYVLGNAGLLSLERGLAVEAQESFERAHRIVVTHGEIHEEAHCLGRMAAALALLGRWSEAALRRSEAEALAARLDAATQEVVRLHGAVVDAALAERAEREGEVAEARRLADAALREVARVTAPGASGARSIAKSSDEIRATVRMIRPRLATLSSRLR